MADTKRSRTRTGVRRFICGAAFGVAFASMGCGGDGAATDESSSNATAAQGGLGDADFKTALSKRFVRETNANLSDDAFETKWTASLESGVLFMRSFPGAYHEDLAQVAASRVPGGEGLCLGDAHPDNFGFLHIGDETRFAYNDLDDSGFCPILLDAARYFAVLQLFFGDKDLSDDVLEHYVDTLKDASRAEAIDDGLKPDWDKEHAKKLSKLTANDRLVLDKDLVAADAKDHDAIMGLGATDAHLKGTTILDVAKLLRDEGGSGGLTRYWALVGSGEDRTILELKESATPGTELGRHAQTLDVDSRLATLKKAFWSTSSDRDYFYVTLNGTRFLVRDRLAKKSIDLTSLGKKDLANVLHAQASAMALLHAKALTEVTKDDVRAWLKDTSRTLAARWSKARDAAR